MKQERIYPRFIVTKKAEISIKAGHPWVYGEEITAGENVENGATSYPLSQFYLNAQSSSNKINKLDESSALLRKKVCLKYYNILKQIVRYFFKFLLEPFFS